MGFTLKALLPPAICFVAVAYFARGQVHNMTAGALELLALLWCILAGCVVLVYWALRIYQRFMRDAPDQYRHR